MIYLRPVGGLCNRIRSVDSFLKICSEYNQNLTVLWTMDPTLNCSFNELFELPEPIGFNLEVIDCPAGFPETNLVKLGKRGANKYKINVADEIGLLKAKAKALLLKSALDATQKAISKQIADIAFDNIITNNELQQVFSSSGATHLTTREMDAVFLPKAAVIYRKLLSNTGDIYVSSCYRVAPLENAYEMFRPVPNLMEKVTMLSQKFTSNTVGLHIRKSDHVVAKSISTTEKFVNKVEEILQSDSNSNFFLSTDDELTKKELLNRYPNKIITQELSGYSRNDSSAIQEALVDLYCLSKTKYILGSHHSSFSQTAADIGRVKEHTVK